MVPYKESLSSILAGFLLVLVGVAEVGSDLGSHLVQLLLEPGHSEFSVPCPGGF